MYQMVSRVGKFNLVYAGKPLLLGIVSKIVYRLFGQKGWQIEEPQRILEIGETNTHLFFRFSSFRLR